MSIGGAHGQLVILDNSADGLHLRSEVIIADKVRRDGYKVGECGRWHRHLGGLAVLFGFGEIINGQCLKLGFTFAMFNGQRVAVKGKLECISFDFAEE